MSRSEFRWNKKRKHYAYLFKDKGNVRLNIVFSTKPNRIVHGKTRLNIRLFKHPNPNNTTTIFVVPFIYKDYISSFGEKVYCWCFDKNDKRTIKRLKKRK